MMLHHPTAKRSFADMVMPSFPSTDFDRFFDFSPSIDDTVFDFFTDPSYFAHGAADSTTGLGMEAPAFASPPHHVSNTPPTKRAKLHHVPCPPAPHSMPHPSVSLHFDPDEPAGLVPPPPPPGSFDAWGLKGEHRPAAPSDMNDAIAALDALSAELVPPLVSSLPSPRSSVSSRSSDEFDNAAAPGSSQPLPMISGPHTSSSASLATSPPSPSSSAAAAAAMASFQHQNHQVQQQQQPLLELTRYPAAAGKSGSDRVPTSELKVDDSPEYGSVQRMQTAIQGLVSHITAHANAAQNQAAAIANGSYSIRVCEDTPLPPVWYCDRPFPRLAVQVVNSHSGMPAVNLAGAELSMRIVNGFGDDSTDKAYGNLAGRSYLVTQPNARANITGLRFNAVSSKQGGHYKLILSLTGLSDGTPVNPAVCEWTSPPIQILSYRLYHAPKIPAHQLQAKDSLSKMKGIGTLYARRLRGLGIVTVADLACVDIEGMGQARCEALLHCIRKDRGAMTLAKLSDYIAQARAIVSRGKEQGKGAQQPSQQPQRMQRAPDRNPSQLHAPQQPSLLHGSSLQGCGLSAPGV